MSREAIALATNPAYSQEDRAVALALGSPRDPTLASYFGGVGAASGVIVNEQTALNYSAVFACLNIISSSLAMMPKCVYRRGADDSRTEDRQHVVYQIVDKKPNEHMTPFVFWQLMHHWAPSWGNAYAEIERTKGGTPVALWPIHPSRVRPVKLDGESNAMGYEVFRPYGGTSVIEADDMIHILGPSYDGYFGYSVIAMARESIGLGMAQEKFGATFFGNNCRPGAILEHPRKLQSEARKNLRESIENLHKGPHNSNRLMILEEGMKLSPWTIPPNDAQFLESRAFQLDDICRWFNVPPHMVYNLGRSTFNNIEHQGTDFVRYTLSPWATRSEQESDRKLFNATEQRTYYTKYEFDELQRGDKPSRYGSYAIGRQWGWLSANDVRASEHMNPIPDGNEYMAPGNMLPIDDLGKQVSEGPPSQPIKPPAQPGKVPQQFQRSASRWYAELRGFNPDQPRDRDGKFASGPSAGIEKAVGTVHPVWGDFTPDPAGDRTGYKVGDKYFTYKSDAEEHLAKTTADAAEKKAADDAAAEKEAKESQLRADLDAKVTEAKSFVKEASEAVKKAGFKDDAKTIARGGMPKDLEAKKLMYSVAGKYSDWLQTRIGAK